MTPRPGMLRLYHERYDVRPGALDARDEEECFTSTGRRVGIWLTTEIARGPSVFEADVELSVVEAFEVTADDAVHRAFVVPGGVVTGLGFHVG